VQKKKKIKKKAGPPTQQRLKIIRPGRDAITGPSGVLLYHEYHGRNGKESPEIDRFVLVRPATLIGASRVGGSGLRRVPESGPTKSTFHHLGAQVWLWRWGQGAGLERPFSCSFLGPCQSLACGTPANFAWAAASPVFPFPFFPCVFIRLAGCRRPRR